MSTPTTTAPAKTTPGAKPPAGNVKLADAEKWERPTNKIGLEALSTEIKGQIEMALPAHLKHPATADRLVRCLLTECGHNERLLSCTPRSLFVCAIRAAQLGFEIGGPLGKAYLIPYKNNKRGVYEAQLIPGYKGLIDLAHNSGKVKRITPVTVRDGDEFSYWRGMKQDLIHRPKPGNNGRPTNYYVVVELITGGVDFETFTVEDAILFRDDFATVRNASDWSKKDSPWYDIDEKSKPPIAGAGFNAMAEKTLIKRIAKRTPMSATMSLAIGLEDSLERGQYQHIPLTAISEGMPPLLESAFINDEKPPKNKAEELRERLDDAKNGGNGQHQEKPEAAEEATGDVDALELAIAAFHRGGGDVRELCGVKGWKIEEVEASKGEDRAKYADGFTAAAKAAKEKKAGGGGGKLPGMDGGEQPPK